MSTWIDFNKLRHELKFEDVLRHYGVEIKLKTRGQHVGFCPLPTHNGKRNSPSFSANLDKGIWQCFGCGARGNVLHFACRMENLDPQNGKDFRKASLKMRDVFVPDVKASKTSNLRPGRSEPPQSEPPCEQGKPIIINPPLDFELKDLDRKHRYLASRKLTSQTMEKFGLGFCSRGYFKNRIVMPLYDGAGRLIGYAGRLINDDEISEDNPKYLFPGSRERDGKILEFRKSLFVYGGHLLKSPVDDLVVVEGLVSVQWLYQNDIREVVGLMGWACSKEQGEIIVSHVRPGGRVWILSDGDEAGERCAVNVFQYVAHQRSVRWLKLENGRQPTDCGREELRTILYS